MIAGLVRVRPNLLLILGFGAIWVAALAWSAAAGLRIAGLGDLTATLALLVANALVYRRFRLGDRAAALLSGFTVFFALASRAGSSAISSGRSAGHSPTRCWPAPTPP